MQTLQENIPSTELNELYKEKNVIMQYLKRFLTDLYDIKGLSNFKLHGYIEDLVENGYKMYKIVHGNIIL